VLPKERRPGAEFLAWSAVPGHAKHIKDGPVRDLPQAQSAALQQRLVGMVEQGL
jgi:hypothetical protein